MVYLCSLFHWEKVFVRGEQVYSLHAYFIAIGSNRFKTHYQRCMLCCVLAPVMKPLERWVRYLCAKCLCYSVCVCICIICLRGSQCLKKPSVLTVNPEVHPVYLDLVNWQKISKNKHPSVSPPLSQICRHWNSASTDCQAVENMNVCVRIRAARLWQKS